MLVLLEDGTLADFPKVSVQDCAENPEDISPEAVWVVNRGDETGEEVVTVRFYSMVWSDGLWTLVCMHVFEVFPLPSTSSDARIT